MWKRLGLVCVCVWWNAPSSLTWRAPKRGKKEKVLFSNRPEPSSSLLSSRLLVVCVFCFSRSYLDLETFEQTKEIDGISLMCFLVKCVRCRAVSDDVLRIVQQANTNTGASKGCPRFHARGGQWKFSLSLSFPPRPEDQANRVAYSFLEYTVYLCCCFAKGSNKTHRRTESACTHRKWANVEFLGI